MVVAQPSKMEIEGLKNKKGKPNLQTLLSKQIVDVIVCVCLGFKKGQAYRSWEEGGFGC